METTQSVREKVSANILSHLLTTSLAPGWSQTVEKIDKVTTSVVVSVAGQGSFEIVVATNEP